MAAFILHLLRILLYIENSAIDPPPVYWSQGLSGARPRTMTASSLHLCFTLWNIAPLNLSVRKTQACHLSQHHPMVFHKGQCCAMYRATYQTLSARSGTLCPGITLYLALILRTSIAASTWTHISSVRSASNLQILTPFYLHCSNVLYSYQDNRFLHYLLDMCLEHTGPDLLWTGPSNWNRFGLYL